MPGYSTYQAQKTITDELVTPYANRYLALFVADPTDNNITANEINAAWYARAATGSWAAPTGQSNATQNNNQITFNAVTNNSVQVTHWGIYDAPTGGNLRFSGAFTAPKTFAVADVPFVAANELVLTFD